MLQQETRAVVDAGRNARSPSGAEAAAQMWVDPQFSDQLAAAGLKHFDDVMQTSHGHLLRALSDRENWRLDFHAAHGGLRGAYLKKHHVRSWQSKLRARLGGGPGETAGRVEAENIHRLAADGIDNLRLIAYGERLAKSGLVESFVMTEELAGFTQLDDFLRERFSRFSDDQATAGPTPSNGKAASRPDRRLWRLIRDVARVARRFHESGYNHRDLYCCHFFVRENEPGQFEIRLIDLQRVQRRRWFRRRWIVKDLAQLAYSAPRNRIGCTERVLFLREYLGVRRLAPRHRRLVLQVLFKERLMEIRQGPYR